MPAKKGGSMTAFDAIQTVVKLPFNLAWMVVFEPLHLIMWIIVEKIGNKEIWGAEKLMADKNGKMAVLVKFTKDFRGVLNDYYSWPKIASANFEKCKFCSKKGTWWCVDCSKRMCDQCAYIQHAPGTSPATHSVEEIVKAKDKKGVHFITPVLPHLMFLFVLGYALFRATLLSDNYLSTQVVCPVVNGMRGFTATIDANVFYHYKTSFATWCDYEDSFMRFILDLWVRTLVTESDNTALVFQNFPKAFLFELALTAAVVPVFSTIYAVLLALIYQLECMIPREDHLVKFEMYAEKVLDFTSVIGVSAGNVPPETKRREKPMQDSIEGYRYRRARLTRRFNYYYASSMATLTSMAWQLLAGVLAARLALIWLDCAWIFRGILRVFCLGGYIAADKVRFAGAATNVVSEPLIRKLASVVLSVCSAMLEYMPSIVRRLSFVWFLLILVAVAINFFIVKAIMKERRREELTSWMAAASKEGQNFGQKKTLKE